MKFEITASFRSDLKRLSKDERVLVRETLPTFVAACERDAADRNAAWPASVRVKDVENAPESGR